MAAHKLLEEQNASDELFTKVDALFDKLADSKVDKEELLAEVQSFVESLQHQGKAVSDTEQTAEKDSKSVKSAETPTTRSSGENSSSTEATSPASEPKDQGSESGQEETAQSSEQESAKNKVSGQ